MKTIKLAYEHRCCPVCGAYREGLPEVRRLRAPDGDVCVYVQCPVCGAVYMDPAPTEKALAEFYALRYTTPEYRKIDGYSMPVPDVEFAAALPAWERRMETIKRITGKETGDLLDVGAGYGGLVYAAQCAGWSALGVEPGGSAVCWCAAHHLPVLSGDFCSDFGGKKYDAVCMFELLEHLRDPGAALERALELARPGGRVFATFPDATSAAAREHGAAWIGWKPPTHLQFFSPGVILNLLASANWSIEHLGPGQGYPGQLFVVGRKN